MFTQAETHSQTQQKTLRMRSYAEAINEACRMEMERDSSVLLFGQDVADFKGIQGSTKGLVDLFGKDRVFSTPLSEDATSGMAIGAAMAGMRPINTHIRMDFMLLAINQIGNMATKSHYMYNGQVKVPLTVRTMIGRSWGQGAQHSQALHSLFMHFPGIKIFAPTNAYDVKGALIAAIRDDNPTLIVEHRLLYGIQSHVPEEAYTLPFGQARILQEGRDITVVGISHMLVEAARATEVLQQQDLSVELIDPICLKPLDIDTIVDSVKKTKRLLVVDNAWLNCGASSEILASVMERLPNGVDGQPVVVKRMGFAESPCPTTRILENEFYPDANRIAQQIHKMVHPKKPLPSLNLGEAQEIALFKGPF